MWAHINIRPFKRNTHQGFTIVELLIVIVVIGILAAITIVTYSGVQQRARNTQVITGVNAYVKAFANYSTLNATYPTNWGCLGANYPSGQCWVGDSGTFSTDPTLDANLATVTTTRPTLATSLMSIGITNNIRAGALYEASPTPEIIFYLAGTNQNCGIAGSAGHTEGGVVTQCILVLP